MTHRTLAKPLFALVLVGAVAQATLVTRVTLEQMVDDSELIVQATVLRSWAAWDQSRQFIWTHYELQVAYTLKGQPGGQFVVSEPGGHVGDDHMLIVGAPQFKVGGEVVLFAYRTPIGYLRTCGWGQGKFTVLDTAGSSEKIVRSDLRGIELVDLAKRQGEPRRAQTALGELDGLELNQFKARVREVVRARQAKGGQ